MRLKLTPPSGDFVPRFLMRGFNRLSLLLPNRDESNFCSTLGLTWTTSSPSLLPLRMNHHHKMKRLDFVPWANCNISSEGSTCGRGQKTKWSPFLPFATPALSAISCNSAGQPYQIIFMRLSAMKCAAWSAIVIFFMRQSVAWLSCPVTFLAKRFK